MSCPYKPKEHLCWNKEFCSKFSQKCNNKLGNHLHSYLRSNQGKGHFQINLKKSLIWQNLLSVLQFINEGKWFTPNVSDFIMSLLKCKNEWVIHHFGAVLLPRWKNGKTLKITSVSWCVGYETHFYFSSCESTKTTECGKKEEPYSQTPNKCWPNPKVKRVYSKAYSFKLELF